jgi:hypothetical protein
MIAYGDRENHTIEYADVVKLLAISGMTPERCRIYQNEWGKWTVTHDSESDKNETMKAMANGKTMSEFGILEITQKGYYI